MMKTAVLASLASASALSVAKEEVSDVVLKLQQQTHEIAEHLKHPLSYNNNLAQAVKKLSGQPLTSTLKSRVVSKSRRNLRGKKGKGKGKGKGGDDDNGDENGEEQSVARTGFQLQVGFCAGTDLGDMTLTEPHYFTSLQMWNDVCVNGVGMGDDTPFSYANSFTLDESGALVGMTKLYMLHDCLDENLDMTEMIPSDEFTFGGAVTPNGVCTDLGGYGARIAVSESPVVHSQGGGIIVEGEDTSVNDCYSSLMSSDYSQADIVEYSSNDFPTSSGYFPLCHMQDSGNDDYDDGDDLVPEGGSYMYDLSRCNEDPPKRIMNVYTSSDCSGTISNTFIEDADMCVFDGREAEDFLYLFQNCWSGA
jgi:hypothetical protein